MNRKLIVAGDSFKKQMKSIAFWAMVLVPILVMLVPMGINYFLEKSDAKKLGDDSSKYQIVADESIKPYLKDMENDFVFVTEKEAKTKLEDEKIESYAKFWIENARVRLIINTKTMDAKAVANLPKLAEAIQNQVNLENADLSLEEVSFMSREPYIKIEQIDKGKSLFIFASYYILLFFMYFMLIMYSNILIVDIATEKGSKMIEFIFSSVSAKDYFAGKIMGNFFAIILHSIIYIILGIIAYFIAKSKGILEMININIAIDRDGILIIAGIFILIILSLLAYMIIAAMLGSLASKQEDASKVATPLMVTIIGAFMIAMIFINRPTNLFVKIASYVPYISVFFMPLRLIKANAGLSQAGISIAILLASLYISYILASKVYKKHILNYSAGSFLTKKSRKKKNK